MQRIWLLSLVLVLACQDGPEPAPAAVELGSTPTSARASAGGTAGDASPTRVDGAPELGAAGAPGELTIVHDDPTLPGPARNLSVELRDAIQKPEACLQDYRPSAAMTIHVEISAVVRPSGMVIEPDASAPGLSANDQRCFEKMVSDVVLSPLSTQVSEPVSTSIDIAWPGQGYAVDEYDVGGPKPDLEDVERPLPKKPTIPKSGIPIKESPDYVPGKAIEYPHGGVPPTGPKGVPVEGPRPVPIEGYQVEEDAERWTDD